MKIQREIVIYQKTSDIFIEEIITNLSLELLIEIFNIDIEDDPNVYKIYAINNLQFLKLKELIPELSKFDFDEVEMFLECYQID